MTRSKSMFRYGLLALALTVAPWATALAAVTTQVRITQVDASDFPRIRVYVSLTNAAGEPVAVDPDQLSLSENGQPVEVEATGAAGEFGPLTTLLVVDVSGSMNEADKLAAAKAAAQAYVDQMRAGDRAGLMVFNTQTELVQPITDDRQALSQAIAGLRARHDTAMYDALVEAVQGLQDEAGRNAILVLTDGLDNRSQHTLDQVIEQIGPAGLSISTIGLGDPSQKSASNAGLDEAALRMLAERAGGRYSYANDAASLRALYEQHGRTLQGEYVLTYTTAARLRDGVDRSLTVQLADSAAADQSEYNPGGLVPEVAQRVSLPLLAALGIGAAVLLLAPAVAGRVLQAVRGLRWPDLGRRGFKWPAAFHFGRPKSRIRVHAPAAPRVRLR